jgi:hypothetical protein
MPDVSVQTGERKKRGVKPGTIFVHRTPEDKRRMVAERQKRYLEKNHDKAKAYRKEYYRWRSSEFYKFLSIDAGIFN